MSERAVDFCLRECEWLGFDLDHTLGEEINILVVVRALFRTFLIQ